MIEYVTGRLVSGSAWYRRQLRQIHDLARRRLISLKRRLLRPMAGFFSGVDNRKTVLRFPISCDSKNGFQLREIGNLYQRALIQTHVVLPESGKF